jgi:hypothetical protein
MEFEVLNVSAFAPIHRHSEKVDDGVRDAYDLRIGAKRDRKGMSRPRAEAVERSADFFFGDNLSRGAGRCDV